MGETSHTVLCVDDEVNILNSLKRLLRKEQYTLLTASSGKEGLEILKENDVHLVMSDQRMPEMNGTEFLALIKDQHPEVIRIILTGYTEVDAITESINRGHIYKFFLKPWNDDNLKLEIRKALDQYDLIQDNKKLTQTILKQNEDLRKLNDALEEMVRKRTHELVLRNEALELSQTVLEDIPQPIIGVSEEHTIVLVNNRVGKLIFDGSKTIVIGDPLEDYFSDEVIDSVNTVVSGKNSAQIRGYTISEDHYVIDISPLTGKFSGKGVILTLRQET